MFDVPRWKGEVYSACDVEASEALRFCTMADEERRAGVVCWAARRTSEVAAREERDIAAVDKS